MITRTIILNNHSCNHSNQILEWLQERSFYTVDLTIIQNMITSMLQVPPRLCVMGDLCWNSTSGVPTRVTHDAKPRWYFITEAFQIVTPGKMNELNIAVNWSMQYTKQVNFTLTRKKWIQLTWNCIGTKQKFLEQTLTFSHYNGGTPNNKRTAIWSVQLFQIMCTVPKMVIFLFDFKFCNIFFKQIGIPQISISLAFWCYRKPQCTTSS